MTVTVPTSVQVVRRRTGDVAQAVGMLPDGTTHYAPIGEMVVDGDLAMCHLCGRWFRSVLAHLPGRHGWSQRQYREAFGLERSQSMEGVGTRARRARALARRHATESAIREGCATGHQLAAAGVLTRAAATAARGRRQPEQRRRKTLATLAGVSPRARAVGARRAADRRLSRTASEAAAGLGFTDMGSLVRDRLSRGYSLAAISREAGLHKDWLCRHLGKVDPAAALAARTRSTSPFDERWLLAIASLGFDDVAAYLADRHVRRCWSTPAVAAEVGMTRSAVVTALRRHGIERTTFTTARARCAEQVREITERFGFASIADYITHRRGAGSSWSAIADECGRPETWVRRRAGLEHRR